MTTSPAHDEKEKALQFDISENRRTRKWTKRELLGRALWETVGKTLFALSPRPLWGARRVILRAFGAQVGRDVHILPSVKIAIPWNLELQHFASVGEQAILYSLGRITIGERATISQYAHICAGTHDYRKKSFDLLKSPINIGSDAWICANAFIGPGVTIGKRAIVGACAVIMTNVEDGNIMVGNPARVIGERPELE